MDVQGLPGMRPLWETLGYNTVASLFLFLVAPCYWYSRWNLGCSCIFSEPASPAIVYYMTPQNAGNEVAHPAIFLALV